MMTRLAMGPRITAGPGEDLEDVVMVVVAERRRDGREEGEERGEGRER